MKKRTLLQGLCAASVVLTVSCQPSSVPATSPTPNTSPSSTTTSPTPTANPSNPSTPTTGPSAAPNPGEPSPAPSASTPPAVVESNSSLVLDAPANAPVVALSDVKSIVINGDRFLNNGKGSTTQLKVSLKDAAGTVVKVENLTLIFESLNPNTFSVSANGTITALVDFGSGKIQVTEPTTGLSAALDFSVSSGTISSSGGGGGGGGGSTSTPTPTPTPSPSPSSVLGLSLSYAGLGLDTFRANTTTDGAQNYAKVSTDAAGNYVVVWQSQPVVMNNDSNEICDEDVCFNYVSQSNRLSGADGDGSGVFGQRFRADGVPLGPEFQVNSFTRDIPLNTRTANNENPDGTTYFDLYGQDSPDIAMNASGQFVVVWQSEEQDGDDAGVFAQRYNPSGQPVGGEFQVNTMTTGDQYSPSVAIRNDGSFVVAWEDNGGNQNQAHYRAFTADGNPVSNDQVITASNGTNEVHVAASSSGEVTIAWEGDGFGVQTAGPSTIIGFQRLNSSSSPIGNVGAVAHTNSADSFDVAYLANGQLVFGWESSSDAYFNIYNSANTAVFNAAEKASMASSDSVNRVSIASNGNDQFALSWDSDELTPDNSVYSRIFSYSNALLNSTGEMRANKELGNITTPRDNDRDNAHLAMASNGDLVIVWEAALDHPEDPVYGVFGRLLTKNGDVK
jgi:hypothetical protein